MSDRFQGKYRISSARLPNWDYGRNGVYFVTICVKYMRMHPFGDVVNGVMELSGIGLEATRCWCEIPKHFKFVDLDEFQIMPNHIHGIIHINKIRHVNQQNNVVPTEETQHLASPTTNNKFGPQSQNLGSIIRGYKIGVTKYARENNIEFKWQPRYYDEILRDMKALENVRKYINNNPLNWKND